LIYLRLPVGSAHGWGICGKNLLRQLARLTEVRHVADPYPVEAVGDPLEHRLLAALRIAPEQVPGRLSAPALHAIGGTSMTADPRLHGEPNVGYTFFENELPDDVATVAGEHFDLVVAGSSWCEKRLRERGCERVRTVLQGIDPRIFHPIPCEERPFPDQFVVFSGGKFELRKGQDLVIKAVAVLQKRHRDVLLAAAWHNPWDFSLATMAASPHLDFDPSGSQEEAIRRAVADGGLDPERVIRLGTLPNALMAQVYGATDVGLFPNRCEGGTNLVLMEYMACGKPVIASYTSGHKDVLTAENALRIETLSPIMIKGPQGVVARWEEPCPEETVAHLEWAYQHRDELRCLGQRAAADMGKLTWRRTAEQFLELLEPTNHRSSPATSANTAGQSPSAG